MVRRSSRARKQAKTVYDEAAETALREQEARQSRKRDEVDQAEDDESNDRSSCYSDEDIRAAIRQKHKDRLYRSINNALRSPVARIGDARRIMRTEKKVKRAIRNLHKQRNGDNNGDGSNARNTTPCHDELYKGWWLPFSAYIF